MSSRPNIKFWNIQTIRNRFILNFILLIFFVFILFIIDKWEQQSKSDKASYLAFSLSSAQDDLHRLNSKINYSNLLLQNHLYQPFKDFYARQRKKIWTKEIKQILTSLKKYRNNWVNIKQKQEYDEILDKIRHLETLQDNLEEDIIREKVSSIEGNSFRNQTKKENIKYFNNKVLSELEEINDNIDNLSQLIDGEIQKILQEIKAIENFYFWLWSITGFILLIIAYILINNQVNIVQKSITKIKKQLRVLQNGNIPKEQEKYIHDFKEIDKEIQTIAQEINKVQTLAHEVGERHFETELVIFNDKGEVGESIAEMRKSLNDLAVQNKITNWINEGLNNFNKIIRETNETQILYDSIIKELVKYLKANYGSIFIINDEDEKQLFLELKSVYAFDRKRFIDKQIKLGQSLVGQSWLEKDVIYQEEIPDKYVWVRTGLGEAKPESLLIVPLITNDEVLGVLEIASLKKLDDYEIDFAKQVASNIVSTIFSLKNGERTQRLLQNAQSRTEKMKKQEEVSLRNMEVLVKTQEDMKKNEIKLKAQTSALDNSLATLELDLNGYILDANIIFSEIFRYNLAEIRGESYDIFVSANDRANRDYQFFWEQLQRGKSKKGNYRLINKHNKEIWLDATFTPVKDEFGKYHKILMLAIDITQQKKLSIDYNGQLESLNKSQAIIDFDINGRINYANEIFLKLLKYDLEDILGKHHSILISEENKDSEFYANFWKKLSNGEFINDRFQYVAKDNTEIWVRGSYNPIKNADNEVYKIIQFAQYVGEEKRLEEQMQTTNDMLRKQNLRIKEQNEETQQKVRELTKEKEKSRKIQTELKGETEAIDRTLASISYNEYGFILEANEEFLNIMKYEASELNGEHHSLFIPTITRESPEQKQLWIDLRIGKPQHKEDKYLNKAGEEIWLDTSYTPIIDERGKIIKILQLAFDVSKEKEIETAYREQNKVLYNANAVAEFDVYGTILKVNDIYLDIFGYKTQEILGKHHALFVSKEDKNKEDYHFFWEKLRKGETMSGTFQRVKKDSSHIRVEAYYAPILDVNGNIHKIICLTREIKENKQTSIA